MLGDVVESCELGLFGRGESLPAGDPLAGWEWQDLQLSKDCTTETTPLSRSFVPDERQSVLTNLVGLTM